MDKMPVYRAPDFSKGCSDEEIERIQQARFEKLRPSELRGLITRLKRERDRADAAEGAANRLYETFKLTNSRADALEEELGRLKRDLAILFEVVDPYDLAGDHHVVWQYWAGVFHPDRWTEKSIQDNKVCYEVLDKKE